MTDHPRFLVSRSTPDQHHREHHGAPQVELLFRVVDWWISRKRHRSGRTHSSAPEKQAVARLHFFSTTHQDRRSICTTR
jgi:hypothetical protein